MSTKKSSKPIPNKYYLTPALSAQKRYLDELKCSYESFMKDTILRRKTFQEKVLYLKEFAEAKASFWNAVVATWPELRGKNLSADMFEVTIAE